MSRKRKYIQILSIWIVLVLLALFGCQEGEPNHRIENTLKKVQPTSTREIPTREPTWTVSPTAAAVWTEAPPELQEEGEPMTITLVYDNTSAKAGLQADWGFSALIRYQDQRVLFDTGARGDILLANMQKLGIDPRQIDTVVLSHIHQDHIGGLPSLLRSGAQPRVVLLPSFSQSYQNQLAGQVSVLVGDPDLDLGSRIHTTGEIPGSPPEQALVLDTTRGLIVITGCAHPGVDRIVLEAKRLYKENIYLVIGGFHLGSASPEQIRRIINEFKRLEVEFVAPCHCTGSNAKRLFREAYGDHFLEGGAGFQFVLENQ